MFIVRNSSYIMCTTPYNKLSSEIPLRGHIYGWTPEATLKKEFDLRRRRAGFQTAGILQQVEDLKPRNQYSDWAKRLFREGF
jgi:hypothetical protein